MIEGVKGLRSKLCIDPLRIVEVFEQGEIPILKSRTYQNVSSRIADLACGRYLKGRNTKPLMDGPILHRPRSDAIGTSRIISIRGVGFHRWRERATRLELGDTTHPPSTQNQVN